MAIRIIDLLRRPIRLTGYDVASCIAPPPPNNLDQLLPLDQRETIDVARPTSHARYRYLRHVGVVNPG